MGVNERKIAARSGTRGRGSHICHKRSLAFIVFATAAFFAFQRPLLPLIAGRREGGRQEQDTSLSLCLSHWFGKLGFKAPTKLSLRHSKARLAQQLSVWEEMTACETFTWAALDILAFSLEEFRFEPPLWSQHTVGAGRAPEPSLKKWNINSKLCLASNTVHFPRHWQLVWAFKV